MRQAWVDVAATDVPSARGRDAVAGGKVGDACELNATAALRVLRARARRTAEDPLLAIDHADGLRLAMCGTPADRAEVRRRNGGPQIGREEQAERQQKYHRTCEEDVPSSWIQESSAQS